MKGHSLTYHARSIRCEAIEMVHRARASHIGGNLSIADILAVLYFDTLNVNPKDVEWPERDRFLLSKGHCCCALYAALALKGFFPLDELKTYGSDGSRLLAHASHYVPGVELSTGSLGHALPVGVGLALAAKRKKQKWRVYVIVSDGELDEGSNWEAILFAGHHQLDNLTVIVDNNKIQSLGLTSHVLNLEPLEDKFQGFAWDVQRIDGHNIDEIRDVLDPVRKNTNGMPRMIIADTVKGKGVDFMENQLKWHYKSPNSEEMSSAMKQLRAEKISKDA